MVPLQESPQASILSHKVNIPVGHWRDGLCNCCAYGPCHNHFIMACLCPLGKWPVWNVCAAGFESAGRISIIFNLSCSRASHFPFEVYHLGQARHDRRNSWSISDHRCNDCCLLPHRHFDCCNLRSIRPGLPTTLCRRADDYQIVHGICFFALFYHRSLEFEILYSQQVCHPRILQYRL